MTNVTEKIKEAAYLMANAKDQITATWEYDELIENIIAKMDELISQIEENEIED